MRCTSCRTVRFPIALRATSTGRPTNKALKRQLLVALVGGCHGRFRMSSAAGGFRRVALPAAGSRGGFRRWRVGVGVAAGQAGDGGGGDG
jgi:hypothetical protein